MKTINLKSKKKRFQVNPLTSQPWEQDWNNLIERKVKTKAQSSLLNKSKFKGWN
jgi:hypothetical protein